MLQRGCKGLQRGLLAKRFQGLQLGLSGARDSSLQWVVGGAQVNNLDTNARLVAKTMDTVCAFIVETKLPYKLAFKVRRESKYFLQVREDKSHCVVCQRICRLCVSNVLLDGDTLHRIRTAMLFCFRHSAQNRSEADGQHCNTCVQPAVGETRLAHSALLSTI